MAASEQLETRARPWPPGEAIYQTANQTSATVERAPNVGAAERIVSTAVGALLMLGGLKRRGLTGLMLAGAGGVLAYRGATAHCPIYKSLGIDTSRTARLATHTSVKKSFLIDKPAEELYAFWRNFENLPRVMTHLESVRVIDERRSHWTAKAPPVAGGRVEWDAEIVDDEPNSRIVWRSLPGGDIHHHGSVEFTRALGDRGTIVCVAMEYSPPAGQLGRWVAKLFGEEPEQQIRDDLRNLKRVMEIGEVLTIEGQPRGKCIPWDGR